MDDTPSKCPMHLLTRRGFFKAAGGLSLFAAGAAAGGRIALQGVADTAPEHATAIPFYGNHQAGIITPQQTNTYFAAFDLVTEKRDDIIALLKAWTQTAAKMTQGTDAALGIAPSRLTLTFGFGPNLFNKDGKDRYGLATARPAALVDLPKFNGDQLIAEKTGGDISVQACADDPQAAFQAIRQLTKLAGKTAMLRWAQTGFVSSNGKETPRNLQGFKDGTVNPKTNEMDNFVWAGNEGPAWMQGGSYVVARRIRIALEHWDNTEVDFQEQVIGRHKMSGAPLGKQNEFDAADFDAVDKDGNPLIAENAHLRLASAVTNGGAQILRRGYSYNDGVNFTAERWPPWRQGMEYDAGLLFVAYQRDPRSGFIKIFDKMAKLDALNQFVTHTGSGLFACPPGVREGEYIGQRLFA